MINSVPTAADARSFDQAMMDFYRARLAAGSRTPVEDTEEEFGEDAAWCVSPAPFSYSDGVVG